LQEVNGFGQTAETVFAGQPPEQAEDANWSVALGCCLAILLELLGDPLEPFRPDAPENALEEEKIPNGAATRFNHACVGGLNRAWLRVVADLGNRSAGTVDPIDEKFVGLSFSNDAVNRNLDHSFFLYSSRSKSVPGAWA
jgi:hypothetical protein